MLDVSSDQLADACHSARYVSLVANKGPFDDLAALKDAARYVWWHEVRQLRTRSKNSICALFKHMHAKRGPPGHLVG